MPGAIGGELMIPVASGAIGGETVSREMSRVDVELLGVELSGCGGRLRAHRGAYINGSSIRSSPWIGALMIASPCSGG
jgi:hypothetical protein